MVRMKCQGLPNGPCPFNRQDGSVRWRIADLFLCPSCDDERHRVQMASLPQLPYKVEAKSSASTSSASSASTVVISAAAVAATGNVARTRLRRGKPSAQHSIQTVAATGVNTLSTSSAVKTPEQERRASQHMSIQRPPPVESTARVVSQATRQTTAAIAPSNARQTGQCIRCLRVISLTAAGLVYAHGPGCSGSGQPPVVGSVSSVTLRHKNETQSSTVSTSIDTSVSSLSPDNIMQLLRLRRCRVLKRIPKLSRILAAEKTGSDAAASRVSS